MSEPLYAQSQEEKSGSLWERAPAWRNLTAVASVLTIAALALPIIVPQPAQTPSQPGVSYPAATAKLAAATVAPQAAGPAQTAPAVSLTPDVHAALPTRSASISHATPLPANPAVESPQQACTIQMANSPTPMSGTVIGFIPHDQSVNIFHNTGLSSGGVVNPAFLDDTRVMVRPDPGTQGGSHNPVVPAGLTVHVGDHVTYQTPYRDPSMRCGFFPSQVTADQGPVAAPSSPMPAPPPVQAASLPPTAPVTAPAPSPTPAPATQSNVCLMVMPPAPTNFGRGMVLSFEDRATSLARIKLTESQTGGQIDPDYVDNLRVTVKLGNGAYHVFLVPKTMQVHPGDTVTFQSGYRNLNIPCGYIPNLITADLGPMPDRAASAAAPTPNAGPLLVH